jgi:hypothetical protein
MTMHLHIAQIIADLFRTTVSVHKRRCANRLGVREITPDIIDACEHRDWNLSRQWCNRCGVTQMELLT